MPFLVKNITRYANECPTINRTSVKWICKYVFKNKERLKNYSNLHLISPSHWMDDCVGKSALFHHVDRMIIPNLLNTVRFSPIDKNRSPSIITASFKYSTNFICSRFRNTKSI